MNEDFSVMACKKYHLELKTGRLSGRQDDKDDLGEIDVSG